MDACGAAWTAAWMLRPMLAMDGEEHGEPLLGIRRVATGGRTNGI